MNKFTNSVQNRLYIRIIYHHTAIRKTHIKYTACRYVVCDIQIFSHSIDHQLHLYKTVASIVHDTKPCTKKPTSSRDLQLKNTRYAKMKMCFRYQLKLPVTIVTT